MNQIITESITITYWSKAKLSAYFRTANMSWRTCVVVKQMQSNPISAYFMGCTVRDFDISAVATMCKHMWHLAGILLQQNVFIVFEFRLENLTQGRFVSLLCLAMKRVRILYFCYGNCALRYLLITGSLDETRGQHVCHTCTNCVCKRLMHKHEFKLADCNFSWESW